MKTIDYNYDLPQSLIAQQPLDSRDQSRLLVLGQGSALEHRHFYELPQFLKPNDLLVLNDTRVIPARLFGRKPSGGKVEVLLLNPISDRTWVCLVKPARRVGAGTSLDFGRGLSGCVVGIGSEGQRELKFSLGGDEFDHVLSQLGQIPLPPYIHKELGDPERYQTVYAKAAGAVAAPTAGLHFTPELLKEIVAMGIRTTSVTLHVGLGTFRPVAAENLEDHRMHSEFYHVPEQAVAAVQATRESGGRVIAVGTTVVRVLEAVGCDQGRVRSGSGWTDIFIFPGYKFKVVNALITNFHLPQSTLLMLVSALAGRERMLAAYREAVARKYRFFSFGDAMMITEAANGNKV